MLEFGVEGGRHTMELGGIHIPKTTMRTESFLSSFFVSL
jgi:hypothetical protein